MRTNVQGKGSASRFNIKYGFYIDAFTRQPEGNYCDSRIEVKWKV